MMGGLIKTNQTAATRHIIGQLMPALMTYANKYPPSCDGVIPIGTNDIEASLAAPSAKVWPRERDDSGSSLFVDDQLMVSRWHRNQNHATNNIGMWRKNLRGNELEIKGALIGPDMTEYMPEGKRDRAYQIDTLRRNASIRLTTLSVRRSEALFRRLRSRQTAARAFIIAGHHARLARLFVLLFLLPPDFAPPFSFFIHLGLTGLLVPLLTGLLPATALLLITRFGHQITPCFALENKRCT
jgi:hypothetical protein